jgi:eukaryotic-like serine/threonine-protein kinase
LKALDQPPEPDVTWGTIEPGDRGSGYAPGDLVTSKYRLERPLGAGGQAAVWEARNLALDSRVALKLLHESVPEEAQSERLLREARAVARLGHPAVVRVFDLATTARGELFIVMELLEGTSLADELLERRRLSAREAVQLLLPIIDALGVAHAQGIVHRDVKPENIFLTRDGAATQPKLLDFGIVKLKRTPEPGWKTAAGTVLGTPAYLSPEQAECVPDVDHRADIWALSATLYECVTGRLPFEAETDDALFGQITRSEPASILDHAAGDPALWAIVRRGLAKAREDRWQSMPALGQALARWLVAHGVDRDASGVALEAKWLAGEPEVERSVRTLPNVSGAEVTMAPAAAAPGRKRWGLALALGGALVAATIVFTLLREGPRTQVPAAAAPVVASISAASAPSSAVNAEPAKGSGPTVVPLLPAQSASVNAPPREAEKSKSKAAPTSRRPLDAPSQTETLDLLSPYR